MSRLLDLHFMVYSLECFYNFGEQIMKFHTATFKSLMVMLFLLQGGSENASKIFKWAYH